MLGDRAIWILILIMLLGCSPSVRIIQACGEACIDTTEVRDGQVCEEKEQ